MTLRPLALSLLLPLAACADEPQPQPPLDTTTSGTESETTTSVETDPPVATQQTRGERSENLSAMRPNVSVYVEGPARTTEDAVAAGGSATFETTIRVVNDGEEDLEVDRLHVRFEVWKNDQRTACTSADDSNPPNEVEEDDSEVHRALATCTFPSAGTYEVRTYVSFEGEELEGDFDIERHYAGRTEVVIGG